MSLSDLPALEASLDVQSHAGAASLALSAVKDSHASGATLTVPVADVPIDTLAPYENDIKVEKGSLASGTLPSSSTKFVNGEPIIVTGEDVSNYVVDDRDDGDPALTFRSFVLGTIIAGLGAALAEVRALSLCLRRAADPSCNFMQIYMFKPLAVSVSEIFLLLIIYVCGCFLW
jgi:hypothetical protein